MNHTALFNHLCRGATLAPLRALFVAVCVLLPSLAFGAFGYADNGSTYGVDTGAGLVFQVRKTDGTITSIVYNGVEYNGPSGKGSHIASGLGSATTVTPETDGASYVKIALHTDPSNGVVSDLTHYLIVRNGENTIYMATYATAEPNVGELRWITRLNSSLLTNGPAPSDLRGNTGPIESQDVFGMADGTTRSKYYGDTVTHGKDRAMDLTYCGATGPGVGVWMVYGNRESSAGGPFFRDIQNQCGDDQEIYNYMNSGHNQTEPYRLNVLQGPYALMFNGGTPPTLPVDFSWMGSLGLTGWVGTSGRGTVSGTATGIPTGFQGIVTFANASAQYWTVVNPDGTYTCSGIKAGDYTATLNKGELAVATAPVTVTAGAATSLNLASTEPTPGMIFRIGEWDGTPAGMLNADKMIQMHPSDVRMSPWGPVTYTIGTDAPAAWPAIQMRLANNGNVVRFNLAPNQITDLTVRIGITCSYSKGGARPGITVNNTWTSPIQPTSTQPDSRSFTIGTYRGNNVLYTYTIPASQLLVGQNTLRIDVVSGSGDSGMWLSQGWVYDAIEVDGPLAPPAITYVGSNPLIVSGTSEPGRSITVTLDGTTTLGTATASASGVWSLTYGGGLAPAAHSLTAVATDGVGHTSPFSSAYPFNSSITMPVITSAVGDTGTYGSGATTSDRVFVFKGTAAAGDSVALTLAGTGLIGSAIADATGHWVFDYTTVSLPDGQNSLYATASNASGTSPSSPVFTLNLQGAPRVAIVRWDPPTQTITAGIGAAVFRVTFNHTVSNVTPAAFALAATGSASGSVASVSTSAGSVFDVTVNALAGTGTLRLDLKPTNGIVDSGGNPEAGYTAGQSYTLVVPTTGNGVWTQPASGGRWSDPRNWLNAVIADGAGSSADFSTLNLVADNTVHLDAPRTVNSLAFADSDPTTPANWVVDNFGNTANTLTLAGASPTISVGALGTGAVTTIQAAVAGTAGLTKSGAGTLVLSAANSLSGPLNVSTGIVQIPAGASQTATTVNLATPSGTLDITGGTFTATGTTTANGAGGRLLVDGGTGTFAAVATNNSANGLIRVNGGTFTAASINIPRSSDATASFSFGFVVTGGTAVVNGPVGLGTNNSWGSMSVEGGTVTVTGPVNVGFMSGTGARGGQMRVTGGVFNSTDATDGLVLGRRSTTGTSSGNAYLLGGVSTIEKIQLGLGPVSGGSAALSVNGGTVYVGSGGIVKGGPPAYSTTVTLQQGTLGAKASWSTSLPLTLPNGGAITIKTADAADTPYGITLSGVLSGGGGFTKTGAGTLVLDGAVTHTFTGPVNVNGGALQLTSTLGASLNPVAVNSGGRLSGNGTLNRPITLNNGGTVAPDAASAIATLNGTDLTWNGGGTFAIDLGAASTCDEVVLTGVLTKGAAGAYTIALNATTTVTPGDIYTVATFASTTFGPTDIRCTGLPPGFGARAVLTPTSLRVVIVAQPVITSANTATGTYAAAFSYAITASNGPTSFGASNLPPGLSVDPTTGIISGVPTAAGLYNATISATNEAGTGTAPLGITIAKAVATVSVGVPGNATLRRRYDGTPQFATITSTPPGLNATFTYNGSSTPPVLPGTYDVVATINDPNYSGTASGKLVITITALVRHAPSIDGDLDGSFQMLTPENVTLNGSAIVSGDLLVPGTPQVRLNGNAVLVDTHDAAGNASPSNYAVTLNGSAMARYVVRRVDPIPMPTVASPGTPTGTRSVVLNRATDAVGDFATVRNLTINGNVGTVAVPAGTYGSFVVNGGNTLELGVSGATEPAVYDFARLLLNGDASIRIVGPVVLRLGDSLIFNGIVGAAGDPSLLTVEVANGGVILNGGAALHGTIVAPNGGVIINGRSSVHGTVTADRLTINGDSTLIDAP